MEGFFANMKSTVLKIVAVAAVLLSAHVVHAGGGCPDRANRLEDFAGCMAPMRGEMGTVYRGTLADVNGDAHSNLMWAMHNAPVVPPHVMPPSPSPVPLGMWSSMMAVAAAKAYREDPHSPIWSAQYVGSLYYPYYYHYPW